MEIIRIAITPFLYGALSRNSDKIILPNGVQIMLTENMKKFLNSLLNNGKRITNIQWTKKEIREMERILELDLYGVGGLGKLFSVWHFLVSEDGKNVTDEQIKKFAEMFGFTEEEVKERLEEFKEGGYILTDINERNLVDDYWRYYIRKEMVLTSENFDTDDELIGSFVFKPRIESSDDAFAVPIRYPEDDIEELLHYVLDIPYTKKGEDYFYINLWEFGKEFQIEGTYEKCLPLIEEKVDKELFTLIKEAIQLEKFLMIHQTFVEILKEEGLYITDITPVLVANYRDWAVAKDKYKLHKKIVDIKDWRQLNLEDTLDKVRNWLDKTVQQYGKSDELTK